MRVHHWMYLHQLQPFGWYKVVISLVLIDVNSAAQ